MGLGGWLEGKGGLMRWSLEGGYRVKVRLVVEEGKGLGWWFKEVEEGCR